MLLKDLRKQLKTKFNAANIEQADADFLIAECLNVPVNNLVFITDVFPQQTKHINACAKKRLKHVPVNRIFNKAYFYGEVFEINKHVLAPRQDSEVLVSKAIEIINNNSFKSVLDVGTGSGCIAINIAKNTNAKVWACDVSKKAIKTANNNAKKLNASVSFVKTDMFKGLKQKFNIIVSNPPYIESEIIKTLQPEVKLHDPILALDGGADGLKFYRKIAIKAKNYLTPKGYVVLEIGYNQQLAVKEIFKEYEFIKCVKDLSGNDRVMIFRSLL